MLAGYQHAGTGEERAEPVGTEIRADETMGCKNFDHTKAKRGGCWKSGV